MHLKFHGVRGSIATPVARNLGFGGNTSSLEIRGSSNEIVLIDAGTGIREPGERISAEAVPAGVVIHLLFTHLHWDHIQGLPFFSPMYVRANQVFLYSQYPPDTLRKFLETQMTAPFDPRSFDMMCARRTFIEARPGERIPAGGMSILPFPLHHPQGALGYRLESGGSAMVHASDHEHGDPECDRALREYAQNANVLVYDAQYTPEEYKDKKGWGHSTWLEAARLANDASVDNLFLFHHDPQHDDSFMNRVREEARREFEGIDVAREGSGVELAG